MCFGRTDCQPIAPESLDRTRPDVNQATGLIEGVFGHLLRAAAVHVEPPLGIARKYRLRRSTGFASA
jgi:hypothetical protein